jgi:hypothetical protein
MATDEELLSFDVTKLADCDTPPRELLRQHGDLYRHDLGIALRLDQWRGSQERRPRLGGRQEHADGITWALAEVVAHLRQGDFMPGSDLADSP